MTDGRRFDHIRTLCGAVRLLELPGLLVGQRHVERCDGLLELLGLADADDRRRHARLPEQPRERDLRGRIAALARDDRVTRSATSKSASA